MRYFSINHCFLLTGTAGYGYKDIHQIFFCGSTLSKFHYKILINIRV